MHIVDHTFSGMVRKSSTVAGPYRIDAAFVVGEVEELAGLLTIDPVALPVFTQVFLFELVHRHVQVKGDTDHILPRIRGGHRFAAVCTGKAVRLLPHCLIGFHRHPVEPAWRLFFEPVEKLSKSRFVASHFVAELAKVNLLHGRGLNL